MGKAHTKMDEKAIPKSELLAAALRYRTPHPPKEIATPHIPKQRSHLPTSQKRSPPTPPKANCLQQRFAIASPTSQKRSPPHIPKKRTACSSASLSHFLHISQKRTACSSASLSHLLTSQNKRSPSQIPKQRSHSHTPQQRSPSHIPKSDH